MWSGIASRSLIRRPRRQYGKFHSFFYHSDDLHYSADPNTIFVHSLSSYLFQGALIDDDAVFSQPDACTFANAARGHSFSPALQQILQLRGIGWLVHRSAGPEYCRRAHLERFLAACPPSSTPAVFQGWIAVSRRPLVEEEMQEGQRVRRISYHSKTII